MNSCKKLLLSRQQKVKEYQINQNITPEGQCRNYAYRYYTLRPIPILYHFHKLKQVYLN